MVPDFEVRLARGFATPRILIVLLHLSKASQLMDPPLDTNMTLNERKFRPFVLEIHRIFNAQHTLQPSHPGPRSDLTEFEKGPFYVHTRFQPVRKSSSSSPTS